jgi:hypothetical protein
VSENQCLFVNDGSLIREIGIVYGGKPLSLEDSYDGGLYFLNLR